MQGCWVGFDKQEHSSSSNNISSNGASRRDGVVGSCNRGGSGWVGKLWVHISAIKLQCLVGGVLGTRLPLGSAHHGDQHPRPDTGAAYAAANLPAGFACHPLLNQS